MTSMSELQRRGLNRQRHKMRAASCKTASASGEPNSRETFHIRASPSTTTPSCHPRCHTTPPTLTRPRAAQLLVFAFPLSFTRLSASPDAVVVSGEGRTPDTQRNEGIFLGTTERSPQQPSHNTTKAQLYSSGHPNPSACQAPSTPPPHVNVSHAIVQISSCTVIVDYRSRPALVHLSCPFLHCPSAPPVLLSTNHAVPSAPPEVPSAPPEVPSAPPEVPSAPPEVPSAPPEAPSAPSVRAHHPPVAPSHSPIHLPEFANLCPQLPSVPRAQHTFLASSIPPCRFHQPCSPFHTPCPPDNLPHLDSTCRIVPPPLQFHTSKTLYPEVTSSRDAFLKRTFKHS
ncbi:uncharacterized protein [Penaeus vannamei]|uniref:uncharacterized protein n=1 Tax=Penaeus vannamei TaxID=6689 RepID=UPI00387F5A78